MTSKYHLWILEHVPASPDGVLAKCTLYVPRMAEAFPELKVVRGVVSSAFNRDNYSETNHKGYPHMWLTSPDGEIIDPTVMQFYLLGKLDYRAFPDDATECFRCVNCGRHFTDKCISPNATHLLESRVCSQECLEAMCHPL